MKQGFTLIELLVVVLIVGILSAVALPQYMTAVEKARSAEALTLMSAVRGAAERYRLQKDQWPDNFTKLDVEVPKVSGTTKYGGKNFTIVMAAPSGATSNTFVVTAKRELNKAPYVLKTILVEDTDGTINATRCCGTGEDSAADCTAPTAGSDIEKFCSAITSGKNSNF